ncbi:MULTISPECIES: aldose 1-epimerase [unclassified Mesorhizobium]|uniref:aldose 1-epimerase n=1 Tax=unclassified Mesorhizobium TaxID=325217 RepID=UPI00095EF6F7|nr:MULTISPECIES: aldose 1-epimerase [unclassified Mesorhizobium]MBN9253304.1 aldose 1-epimerase [Mesorhizobium sp.]OJX82236.1 MAG: hypothetical protein BGO93_23830 [Mesorhizobium sp. 65-26]
MQGRKDFRLRLRAGVLTLELVPSLGGAVSAFRLETRAGPFDLFRSLKVPEGAREDALHAGCFPMVPFANCIRDNRFGFEGRRYAVSPNMAGSRLNFHGSGWQSAWQVAARALDRVELRLGDGRVDGVYRYEAVQLFELDPRALTLTTTLRNRGERAMPFSFGQHPWFPRHGGMLVRFRAGAVLGTDAEGGALSREPIAQDADYSVFRSVPAGYRNQCYAGWTGEAEIAWPANRIGLAITADPVFGHLMLHAPASGEPVVCLEPQSPAPCGFDGLEEGKMAPGVFVLAPGEAIAGAIRFEVS